MLRNVPCYGNNDSYADEIGKEIDRISLDFTKKYSKELGVHLDLRLVPFTSHVPFGKVVSATPNGRYAYTPCPTAPAPPMARTSTAPPPFCCPTTPPRTTTTASAPPVC